MFDFMDYAFNQRALFAVLLIGFSNGALGTLVVLRKNALVISALSHSLLPGIALAMIVFGGMTPFVGFVGALVSALMVGLSTVYVARKGLLDHQTATSVLYTTAFAGGLLLLDFVPGNVHLESWLFGNILGLRNMDLWISYGVSTIIVMVLAWHRRDWILYLFDPSVAASMGVPVPRLNYMLTGLMVLALVTSLQAVGAVLSAALFIIPTATLLQWIHSPRKLMWCSGALGSGAGVVAIALSNWWNVQTGATLILLLGCCFLVSLLVAPKR
ncbi:metal ABC transporter permease [Kiritimatiellota bacterium B12222]|nr:metal ABC transporter permease [Kiritimatiellota bacterium B12222]